MSLQPDTLQSRVDSLFTVEVVLTGPAGQQIDAGEVHLDFDPALMEVVAMTPAPELPILLVDEFDNTAGTIDLAAGTFGSFPALPLTLLTIEFRALQPSLGTTMSFLFQIPERNSAVTFGGNDILSQTTPNLIRIEPGPDYCAGIVASEQTSSAEICAGDSVAFFGRQLTEAGSYRDTLRDGFGCDSVLRSLDLTVLAADTTRLEEETTDPSQVGIDSTRLTNQAGCDSLVIVQTRLADPTGLQPANPHLLRVFPNPAQDRIEIQAELPILRAVVYDARGRVVLEQRGHGPRLTLTLPMAGPLWLHLWLADAREIVRTVQRH
jgi:hypothetical protein